MHDDHKQLRECVIRYFTVLEQARAAQRSGGSMGVDGHLQDLHEAEAALREEAGWKSVPLNA